MPKATGERKLTWQQHMQEKRKQEEKAAQDAATGKKTKSGRCDQCDHGSFTQSVEPGAIIVRTCKKCGDQKRF